MKIKHRLLVAYFAITATLCLFGFFSYQSNLQVLQEYEQLSHKTTPVLSALNKVRFSALRVVSSTSEAGLISALKMAHGIELGHSVDGDENEEAFQGRRNLRQSLKQYRALVHRYFPDEVEVSTQIQQLSDELLRISDLFFTAIKSQQSAAALLALKQQFEQVEIELFSVSQAALNHELEEIEEHSSDVNDSIGELFQMLIFGVTVSLLVVALMALSHAKNIARPITRLKDAVARISRGDYTTPVPVVPQDELGQLSLAFNQMLDDLKQNQQQLKEAHRYTENILHVMEDVLIATDKHGVMKKVNRAACEQLGYREAELLGRPLSLLLEQGKQEPDIAQLIPVDEEEHSERSLRNAKGHRVPVLASMSSILSDNAEHEGFLFIATNISARKLAEDKIHKLTFYDSLSGLPNRTLFNDRLQQAVKYAHRKNQHLAVLFLDLDNFKQVNDSLGHDVGDELLRQVSERLVEALRESDIIAHEDMQLMSPTVSRHGGDEFLILLPYVADPLDAGKVVERIQHLFCQPLQVNMQDLYATFSTGIAIFPEDGMNERLLMQNADTALYSAKSYGKNQFAFFDMEMNILALKRLDVENN
ncbi:MAG: diguanylate cyclase [Motiliproteus sp.]